MYNASGGVVRLGLYVLTIPLLIRLIGIEEFGLWSLVSATIALLNLMDAGLSTATTLFISRDLADQDERGIAVTLTVSTVTMLVVATVTATLLAVGASALVGLFPTLTAEQMGAASVAFRIGGIIIWMRLVQVVLLGLEQAYGRYAAMNLLNTFQVLLLSLGLLAVAYMGGRIVAMMAWHAVVTTVLLIAHLWVATKPLQTMALRPSWNSGKARAIARYSGMAWLASLGPLLFSHGDRIVVGAILGPASLGIYSAITSVTSQISALTSLAVHPILPTLGSLISRVDVERSMLEQSFWRGLAINIAIAMGSGLALLVAAPFVMELVIGEAPDPTATLALRVATLIYMLYSVSAVGHYTLLALDAIHYNVLASFSGAVLSLSLIAALSSQAGLIGAAAGNAGYLIILVLLPLGLNRLRALSQQTGVTVSRLPK